MLSPPHTHEILFWGCCLLGPNSLINNSDCSDLLNRFSWMLTSKIIKICLRYCKLWAIDCMHRSRCENYGTFSVIRVGILKGFWDVFVLCSSFLQNNLISLLSHYVSEPNSVSLTKFAEFFSRTPPNDSPLCYNSDPQSFGKGTQWLRLPITHLPRWSILDYLTMNSECHWQSHSPYRTCLAKYWPRGIPVEYRW